MISIRDLQEQLTGELQNEIVVKQWNYDIDDFDFVTPLYELPSNSPVLDRPIKFMYADTVRKKSSCGDKIQEPTLFIEVDGDFE